MKQEYRDRFARLLQEWIDECGGIGQREAAQRIGVGQGAVQSWLKGRSSVRIEHLESFALVTGKTPEALLAEVRGVRYEQVAAKLTYQDIEKLVIELDVVGRRNIVDAIMSSFIRETPPVAKAI